MGKMGNWKHMKAMEKTYHINPKCFIIFYIKILSFSIFLMMLGLDKIAPIQTILLRRTWRTIIQSFIFNIKLTSRWKIRSLISLQMTIRQMFWSSHYFGPSINELEWMYGGCNIWWWYWCWWLGWLMKLVHFYLEVLKFLPPIFSLSVGVPGYSFVSLLVLLESSISPLRDSLVLILSMCFILGLFLLPSYLVLPSYLHMISFWFSGGWLNLLLIKSTTLVLSSHHQ